MRVVHIDIAGPYSVVRLKKYLNNHVLYLLIMGILMNYPKLLKRN